MDVKARKFAVLKQYWGYDSFRDNQSSIIDSVLDGKDTIALMATGGGKSMCYQLPALILEGICIVISPLIALMEDQERTLRERGIQAESIHSGKSKKRQDEILDNCIYGKVKFLFLSPEKLQSEIALVRLQKMKISFFAIDEAHCISQWGQDFRPAYLKLNIIKELFPDSSILALTATATSQVVNDIIEYLQLAKNHRLFTGTFFRSNLSITVLHSNRKFRDLTHFVLSVPGSKIVYARNKRHCTEIKSRLQNQGISAEVYHADVPIDVRKKRQEAWLKGKLDCMVCTSAFGMGIDKSNVRLVVHFDLPPSLEEYIQEIGRAGRDGKMSYVVMLFNNYDLEELEFHFQQGTPSSARIKDIYHQLGTFLGVAMGDGFQQGYPFDSSKFISQIESNKIELRTALQILESNDYLSAGDTYNAGFQLRIKAGKQALDQLLQQEGDLGLLIGCLLRNYEGLLYGFVSISLEQIQRILSWPEEKVKSVIEQAKKREILDYKDDSGSENITYLSERMPKANIYIDQKALRSYYKAKKHRYEKMVDYVISQQCRAVQLLAYFDEYSIDRCGVCDVCKGFFDQQFSNEEFNEARHLILSTLSQRELKMEEVLKLWPLNKRNKLKSILQKLSNNGDVVYTEKGFKLAKIHG